MSGGLTGFLRRHRYKFMVLGALGAGAVMLKCYAERRLRGWADGETQRLLQQMQKQSHFESTRATCGESRRRLTTRLRLAIARLADADAPLTALRDGAPDKLAVWQQLKRVAIQRVLGAAYSAALLTLALEVRVNALGGCLYVDSRRRTDQTDSPAPLSDVQQQRYLAGVELLLTDGLRRLMSALALALDPLADALTLKELLTLGQLETLLRRAHEAARTAGVRAGGFFVPNSSDHPAAADDGEDGRLRQLQAETRDLLQTVEMDALLDECVSVCLQRLLDQLTPNFTATGVVANGDLAGSTDVFTSPHTTSLPVAKLLPLLVELPLSLLSDGPDSFTWIAANHHRVQALAANVYESFSADV